MRPIPVFSVIACLLVLASAAWCQPAAEDDEEGVVTVQEVAPAQPGLWQGAPAFGGWPMNPMAWQMMQGYGGWQMQQFQPGWGQQPVEVEVEGEGDMPPGGWAGQPQQGPAPGGGIPVTDGNWGFGFMLPRGWQMQKTAQSATLTSQTFPGQIILLKHNLNGLQEIGAFLQQPQEDEGLVFSPAGQPQQTAANALFMELTATGQAGQFRGCIASVAFPAGGGVHVLGLADANAYSPQLANAAMQIAQTVQPAQVQQQAVAGDLVSHFAGVWVNYNKQGEGKVLLAPDGSYYENIERSYTGNLTGAWTGEDLGNWGQYSNQQAAGRWTVQGTREQGQLIITYAGGEQMVAEYKVHTEKGQTYWKEYWFDGVLYGKQ